LILVNACRTIKLFLNVWHYFIFRTLLETNKPYLMNTTRMPAVQSLVLFAHTIDTDAAMTRFVFDSWIEIVFADSASARMIIVSGMELRDSWSQLLKVRLKQSKRHCMLLNSFQLTSVSAFQCWVVILAYTICTLQCSAQYYITSYIGTLIVIQSIFIFGIAVNEPQSSSDTRKGRELSFRLVKFLRSETFYTVKRLLAADQKDMYNRHSSYTIPSECEEDELCFESGWDVMHNMMKGGLSLTSFLTYGW